jgi:hypothetical protein
MPDAMRFWRAIALLYRQRLMGIRHWSVDAKTILPWWQRSMVPQFDLNFHGIPLREFSPMVAIFGVTDMRKPDLTYRNDTACGMFIRFLPETKAGERAWRQMVKHDPSHCCVFLAAHLPSITAQLKAAGYTVAKAKRETVTMTDDELLEALGVAP